MGDYRSDYRGGGYDRRDSYRGGDRRDLPPLPTKDMMGSRVYVGKLPNDIREKEIEEVFRKYGEVREISLKGNYAFVQFESSHGAKEAVYELNNRTLFGDRVQVEHARSPKEFAGGVKTGGGGRDGYRDRERSRYDSGGGGGRYDRGGYDRGGYDRGYDRSYDKGYDRGYSSRDRRRDRSPARGDY